MKSPFLLLFLLFNLSCAGDINPLQNEAEKTTAVLNNENLNLRKGESKELTAIVLLDNGDKSSAVTWTSSDNKIATVNLNGRVNALEAGSVIIKAVSIQDKSKTKIFELKITEDLSIRPVSIEITNTLATNQILVSENLKLAAKVKFDDGSTDNNVSWQSSDENIAFINEQGLIIPKKPGNIIISAVSNRDNKVSSFINIEIIEDKTQFTINQKHIYDLAEDYALNRRENWSYGTGHGNKFIEFVLLNESKGLTGVKEDRYLEKNIYGGAIIWFRNYDKAEKITIIYPGFEVKDTATIRFRPPETGFYKINYSFKPHNATKPTVRLINYRNEEVFSDTYFNMKMINNFSFENSFSANIYLNKADYLYFTMNNGSEFPTNGEEYNVPEKNAGDFLEIKLIIER